MKNNILLLLSALTLLLSACKNSAGDSKVQSSEPGKLELPGYFYKKLRGKIGESEIVMNLVRKDTLLTGSYYYVKTGLPLALTGSIRDDGSFTLAEMDANYEETGSFDCLFVSASTVAGIWKDPSGERSATVELSLSDEKNIASVSFEKKYSEDCTVAERNRKSPIPDGNIWDTMCTTIELDLIRIKVPSAAVSAKINASIARLVSGEEDDRQSADPVGSLMNSVHSDDEDEMGYSYTVTTEVVTNEDPVLCISILMDQYYYGAAHPYAAISYHNFDLATGKLIKLGDLLKPGYQKELNRIAEKNFIRANGSEGWDFQPGKFELNEDFAILPGGLLFSFDPYEIGPYALGMPEVFIPYREIGKLIRQDAIIPAGWRK